MTADSAKPHVRLTSPSDIVDAVPYLVGFQPEDSLVVLSLRGEPAQHSRLGLTARVDLPPVAAVKACAREFVGYLKRDNAARGIVVFYPPSGGPTYPSLRPLSDALTKQLERARIGVADVLCVSEGRWWSLRCTDAACCPLDGTPVSPGTSVAATVMTVAGQVVLSSRKELEQTIAPVGGVVGAAMAYALARADTDVAHRVMTGRRADMTAESLELFRAAVRSRLGATEGRGDEGLSIDDAARLIVGLDDVLARDEVITWFDGGWGDATCELLTELVRRAVPPHDVPTLTTFAWIHYLQGEGVLAGIAVDRALAGEPGYRMALILDQALRVPLNPEVFRALYSERSESGSLA